MLPTPRTQPYRAGAPREITAALQAMLVGRQPGVVNAGDYARQRSQMQANGGAFHDIALQHLQQLQNQRRRPMATADVRGTFGGGVDPSFMGGDGSALHELLAQAMLGQPGVVRRHVPGMLGAPAGAVGPRY